MCPSRTKMSRRKQAKPQCVHLDAHLTSVEHADYNISVSSPPTDVHICERCCAEFFNLPELQEHQNGCCKNPLVLIVNENGSPTSPCPSFTFNSPPNSAEEHMSDSMSNEDTEGLQIFSKDIILNGNKESFLVTEGDGSENTIHSPSNSEIDLGNSRTSPVTLTSGFTSVLPQLDSPPELGKVSSTSSNVFIENLETTKVAVAQFSQELCLNAEVSSSTPTSCSMATPDLIEQLMALQQQQVQQLKLIEQIRHQIFILAAQNTEASAPSSTCQGTTENFHTSPLIALSSHLSQQLAAAAGLVQNLASKPANISSVKEFKHSVSSSIDSPTGYSGISQTTDTDTSKVLISKLAIYPSKKQSTSDSSHYSFNNGTSILHSSAVAPESSSDSEKKFYLPHTHPGNHIFANMSPSIGAIVEDLNALTALAQQRKGKQHNVTSNEHKRPFDEGLFKHKCKFCAKVFGSDSALQIHLRSHTGERPYKCNICGNRFSTRGNLKVHFQRHKEKYPNVQMNPYPVPEHLDNVPTSTGIPYGMSMLPDKSVSNWLDSKPSVTNLPGLMLPSLLPSLPNIIKREEQVLSITRPATPLLDDKSESETFVKRNKKNEELSSDSFLALSEKYEESKNNLSLSTYINFSGVHSENHITTLNACTHNNAVNLLPTGKLKRKFPFEFEEVSNSIEASETTKLQQLVENIDKKYRDPNECRVCHRVLSCQSALKMHYRTHTGERPYKCRMCGRAFTTKGNLKTHYSIHRDMPPVKMQHSCPLCQEKFTNAMVLQQHIRMHMVGKIPIVSFAENHQEPINDIRNDEDGKVLDGQENSTDGIMEIDDFADSKDIVSPSYSQCSSPVPSQVFQITDSESHVFQENDSVDRLEGDALGGSFLALRSSPDDHHVSQNSGSRIFCRATSPWDTMGQKNSTSESHKSFTSEKQPKTSPIEATSPDLLQSDFAGYNSLDMASVDIAKDGVTLLFPSQDRGTLKANTCDICNKMFACQSALDIHYRSHTKERPFICTACNRGFSTKGNLKQHMLTHQMRDLPSRLFEPSKQNIVSPSSPPHPSIGHLMSSKTKMEVNSSWNKDGKDSLLEIVGSIPSPLPALAVPPVAPRRVPKQHFCHTCGKTFSSSSALQIHERTHTGEKPFACSICGRAFTTKGNLKVHMGTHMWNSVPARRGRRLSVDGPMTFLKSTPVKVQENISKDTVGTVSNGESLWSQCATTACTNGMAMKTNEISVIQNGGIPQLPLSVGHGGNSPIGGLTLSLEKLHNVELKRVLPWLERLGENGASCHLTQLMEESKTD